MEPNWDQVDNKLAQSLGPEENDSDLDKESAANWVERGGIGDKVVCQRTHPNSKKTVPDWSNEEKKATKWTKIGSEFGQKL
ncbi:Hypothetical protein NTJ_12470 [Nesidiocoris tenuis]|uniref:Uncharacterized protein n=1 Tax=Nesidiocoris tenuis TaxID=355587 RepID=A0ABN7BA19_9HEMI|nr:Hypothetical protein NTJ_12469 [Nesidiocoris tenuis]BES99653.1 Hypothetical protein NTJ_12470 [Nesidiocoris tenuis]